MELIDANTNIQNYVETWICNCSDYGRQQVMAVDDVCTLPTIDPVHAANACYCKECQYYEPFRNYPDCSKILTYGYCYYWKYEEGESPNEVDENDFCSRGIKGNSKYA